MDLKFIHSEPPTLGTSQDHPRSSFGQGDRIWGSEPQFSNDEVTMGGRGKNWSSSTKDMKTQQAERCGHYYLQSGSSVETKADQDMHCGPMFINTNSPPPELEQATFRERMNQLILEHELLLMEYCQLQAKCEGEEHPQPSTVFGGRHPGEQATAGMSKMGPVDRSRGSQEQMPGMNQHMSPNARSSQMNQNMMHGSSATAAGQMGLNRSPWVKATASSGFSQNRHQSFNGGGITLRGSLGSGNMMHRTPWGSHVSGDASGDAGPVSAHSTYQALPGGIGVPDVGLAAQWDHLYQTSEDDLVPHAVGVDLQMSSSAQTVRSRFTSSYQPEELSPRSSTSPLSLPQDLEHSASAPPALRRQDVHGPAYDRSDDAGMNNGPGHASEGVFVGPRRSVGMAFLHNVMPMQMPTGNMSFGMGNVVTRIVSLSSSKHSLEGDVVANVQSDVRSLQQPAWKLFRLLWAFAWLLCVGLELFLVPFQALLLGRPLDSPAYAGIMSLVSVFFALDMVANFFAAYACDEDKMLGSRRHIATQYLKSWFLVDFIAFLPLELMVNDYGRANAFLHLLKVPMSLAFAAKVKSAGLSSNPQTLSSIFLYTRGVFVLLLAGLLAHFNSCLLAAVAPSLLECLPSVSSKYGEALSITLVYMTTDMTTSSDCGRALADFPELRLVQVMISLQRLALISVVCVACVREVLRGWTQDSMHSSLMRDNTLKYLQEHNVSNETQMSVLSCIEDNRKIGVLMRHYSELSGELPVPLVRKICREMWESKLNTLQLIRHISERSPDFMADLVMMVHEENIAANMTIFNPEDRSSSALFIIEGVLHCPKHNHLTFNKGQWIGEMSLINLDFERGSLVATKTSCRLMVLSASGFQELIAIRGLTDQFTELCKSILFNKACERCGNFGDHNSSACPAFNETGKVGKYSSDPYGAMVETHLSMEEKEVCWGLEKFLNSNNMEHLTSTIRYMGILSLEELVNELQDMESFKESLVQAWNAHNGDANNGEESLMGETRTLGEREWQALTISGICRFREKLFANFQIAFKGYQRDEHLVFLCHYKVESGTEAALIRQEIEIAVGENNDPSNLGKLFNTPAFLDSEDLKDLHLLQGQVHKCHNVFLILTRNVLTRPWCLVEIVTACRLGINVIPVQVVKAGSMFSFPDSEFYERLLSGELLTDKDSEVLTMCKLTVRDVDKALKQVFQKIALNYSPHRARDFRRLEVESMLERCSIVEGLCNKSYKLEVEVEEEEEEGEPA